MFAFETIHPDDGILIVENSKVLGFCFYAFNRQYEYLPMLESKQVV